MGEIDTVHGQRQRLSRYVRDDERAVRAVGVGGGDGIQTLGGVLYGKGTLASELIQVVEGGEGVVGVPWLIRAWVKKTCIGKAAHGRIVKHQLVDGAVLQRKHHSNGIGAVTGGAAIVAVGVPFVKMQLGIAVAVGGKLLLGVGGFDECLVCIAIAVEGEKVQRRACFFDVAEEEIGRASCRERV